MAYRVDLSRIGVLKEKTASSYRPLLDYSDSEDQAEKSAAEEDRAEEGEVLKCSTWGKAKTTVLDHLSRLKDAKRWEMGRPVPVQASIFGENPAEEREKPVLSLTPIEKRQVARFELQELAAMRKRMTHTRMEEVDSRHESIPF